MGAGMGASSVVGVIGGGAIGVVDGGAIGGGGVGVVVGAVATALSLTCEYGAQNGFRS
jgi:hypothetical protein